MNLSIQARTPQPKASACSSCRAFSSSISASVIVRAPQSPTTPGRGLAAPVELVASSGSCLAKAASSLASSASTSASESSRDFCASSAFSLAKAASSLASSSSTSASVRSGARSASAAKLVSSPSMVESAHSSAPPRSVELPSLSACCLVKAASSNSSSASTRASVSSWAPVSSDMGSAVPVASIWPSNSDPSSWSALTTTSCSESGGPSVSFAGACWSTFSAFSST
mmetsp:Transcript_57108/g.179269  ORF Transcript_57108/g.179269 Transcript_57108/m.179269 type:complete len:227 (+) Transcript_57108:2-682(+)